MTSLNGRKSRPWRLGLDVGTNSIGWCVFDLKKDETGRQHPAGIRRMGVRIYTDGRDPQSGASLAQERRGPRGARRRRDRYLDRRADLLKALIDHGLMPAVPVERKKLEALDPWRLRAEGLDRSLTLHELGRALFHLNQRRGFKSNRKAERTRDDKEAKDTQDMKAAARKLDAVIGPDRKDARTLGEYLYKRYRATFDDKETWQPITPAQAQTVRARPTTVKGRNNYEFYPLRSMIEAEFEALWAAQRTHHPELTDALHDEITDIVFYQRPLRPVDPGPCTLDPEEDLDKRDRRAPLALPIQQDFRILQELANLELFHKTNPTVRRRLTLAERDSLYAALKRSDKVTFKRIRILLKIDEIWSFNLESEKRDHLKGDIVSVRLAREGAFGKRWFDGLSGDIERQHIVLKLIEEENTDEIVRIGGESWGLTPGEAQKVADTPLPDGYGRLGLKALSRIVPIMKERADKDGGPIGYANAVLEAGYLHHSDFRDGELLDELPYYGEALQRYTAPVRSESAPEWEREFGRLANPTVHIGLNQLRKLINALIEKYGSPEEIVVELARDLKRSQEEREEVQKQQTENQKKNDLRREMLEDVQKSQPGWRPPRDAMLRLRLWEELDADNVTNRRCVYTGKMVSRRMLFSDEVEIEHILPFTQSLDDSPANLTVSLRGANRDKGNRTPHSAFGHSQSGYDWDQIMLRVSTLPRNKQWRFRPDALDLVKSRITRENARLEGSLPKDALEDIEKTGGFLARQLVDTAYLARVTRQYLWEICDSNCTWVIPGQMTAMLRRKWGLNPLLGDHNKKNRADHRHHAIDAYVVGLTDRSMLQQIQHAAGTSRERIIEDMPDPPWDGWRDELKAALGRIVVSHRPDHGIAPNADATTRRSTSGRLHEETAYGLVAEPDREGGNVVARKPIDGLSENEIDRIRDPLLRAKLKAHLASLLPDDKSLENAKARLADARKAKDKKAQERAQAEIARLKVEAKARRKAGTKDFKAALAAFGQQNGIRRVRLVKPEAAIVVIRDKAGKPYKAYSAGDNLRVEIFERADGSWGREIVTAFDANRRDFCAKWRELSPEPRLVWRLHKNDLVRLQDGGEERVMRVVSIWDRYLQLAGHEETNLAERYRDGEFKWTFGNYDRLKELKFRRVTVSPFGELRDPAKGP